MLDSVKPASAIQRIRRHHALEHATLHILSKAFPFQSVAGYSDANGFWIVGSIPTETLRDTVEEAILRLKAGESQLAIHPNCGTNFAVAGILAGSAAWLVMAFNRGGFRRRLQDWPTVAAASTLGVILAQPLGMLLQQRVTTDSQPGNIKVVEIKVYQAQMLRIHRVLIRHYTGA